MSLVMNSVKSPCRNSNSLKAASAAVRIASSAAEQWRSNLPQGPNSCFLHLRIDIVRQFLKIGHGVAEFKFATSPGGLVAHFWIGREQLLCYRRPAFTI